MSEEIRAQEEFFKTIPNLPSIQSEGDTGSSEKSFGYIRKSQNLNMNAFFKRYDH